MRAKRSAEKLGIRISRIDTEDIDSLAFVGINNYVVIKSDYGITRSLTKYTRRVWLDKAAEMKLHMHSFDIKHRSSFKELFCSPKRRFSNALLSFAVRARTNNLPTPEIREKRGEINHEEALCPTCGVLRSLAHALNGCKRKMQSFTWRHNLLQQDLANAITEKNKSVSLAFSRTLNYAVSDIPQELASLKPDISFFDKNKSKLWLIELTVPYPTQTNISANQETPEEGNQPNEDDEESQISSLDRARNDKGKYEPLRKYLEEELEIPVELIRVVVSSLGTATKETKLDLARLFKSESQVRRILGRLEYDALIGSAAIFEGKSFHLLGDGRASPFATPPRDRWHKGSKAFPSNS